MTAVRVLLANTSPDGLELRTRPGGPLQTNLAAGARSSDPTATRVIRFPQPARVFMPLARPNLSCGMQGDIESNLEIRWSGSEPFYIQ
jgi:hypothetical protein